MENNSEINTSKLDSKRSSDFECSTSKRFKIDLACESSSVPNKISIDILNDDCLYEIFTLLDGNDLLNLEKVSRRWKRISLETWKRFEKWKFNCQKICLNRIGSNEETKTTEEELKIIEEILIRGGSYFNRLECEWVTSEFAKDLFNLIDKYCKQLYILKFDWMLEWAEGFTPLDALAHARFLRNLHVLEFSFGMQDEISDKKLIPILKKAVNLQIFSVHNYSDRGKFLSHLSEQCAKLTISGCSRFENLLGTGALVKNGFARLKNLQVLELRWGKIAHEILRPISNQLLLLKLHDITFIEGNRRHQPFNFNNLRVLDMNDVNEMDDKICTDFLGNSPYLWKLLFTGTDEDRFTFNYFTKESFRLIGKLKSLVYLDLYRTKITDEDLKYLAQGLPNLHKLRFSFNSDLSETGICSMISSLASLNRLRIYGYNPTETLLESAWLSVKARTTGITLVIKLLTTKFSKDEAKKLNLTELDLLKEDDIAEDDLAVIVDNFFMGRTVYIYRGKAGF